MNRSSKIIIIVLTVLIIAVGVFVAINYAYSKERLKVLEKQEIIISEKGEEICRITLEEVSEINTQEFVANLKSSVMAAPEEHVYTGVALVDLFFSIGISLDHKTGITTKSVDGYNVPLKIEEVVALDNIFLVYKDDGKYLGSYGQPNGQGPYMIVIRGDKFSQRWAKYVVGLDIE